jgi:hypothetical protein
LFSFICLTSDFSEFFILQQYLDPNLAELVVAIFHGYFKAAIWLPVAPLIRKGPSPEGPLQENVAK